MIGFIAPDFTLPDQDNNIFNLYSNLDKIVLLIFYPKDNTPVCSRQLKNYESNMNNFAELGIRVVGINTGDQNSHREFRNNCNLSFPLLSDINREVSKKYNALNFLGVNKRKVFLIDTNKIIRFEKNNFSFTFTSSADILRHLKAGNFSIIDLTNNLILT